MVNDIAWSTPLTVEKNGGEYQLIGKSMHGKDIILCRKPEALLEVVLAAKLFLEHFKTYRPAEALAAYVCDWIVHEEAQALS